MSTQPISEFTALEGKRLNIGVSLGLEGAGGLQLLDIKDNGDDGDGWMGLSLTLDEWMKLDSGEIDQFYRLGPVMKKWMIGLSLPKSS